MSRRRLPGSAGTRLAAGAVALAAAGLAYGAYRVGKAYDESSPLAGLGAFARTVRDRTATRERDLRDALGLDLGAPREESAAGEESASGEASASGGTAAAEEGTDTPTGRLSPEQARELLRDPAGPTPGD